MRNVWRHAGGIQNFVSFYILKGKQKLCMFVACGRCVNGSMNHGSGPVNDGWVTTTPLISREHQDQLWSAFEKPRRSHFLGTIKRGSLLGFFFIVTQTLQSHTYTMHFPLMPNHFRTSTMAYNLPGCYLSSPATTPKHPTVNPSRTHRLPPGLALGSTSTPSATSGPTSYQIRS